MTGNIQAGQLISFETGNGWAPKKGSRALPVNVDFSVNLSQIIDLTLADQLDRLETIQGVFIDNSANSYPLTLKFSLTGQILTIPAGCQGFLPALANGATQIMTSTTGGAAIITVFFLSFPVPACVWNATASGGGGGGGAVTVSGNPGTADNGTITAGGTAQNAFGGTQPVNGFSVYNPNLGISGGTGDYLWISDSTTAAAGAAGSIGIAPGGEYNTPPNYKPVGVLSIVGATTGDTYTARRW